VACLHTTRFCQAQDEAEAESTVHLQWSDAFDRRLVQIIQEYEALEQELCELPTPERQAAIGRKMAVTGHAKALGEKLIPLVEDLKGLQSVADDANEDHETREEFRKEMQQVEADVDALRQNLLPLLLPRDPDDELNAILEVRTAAGGQESALFAAELFAMYQRYAARMGWQFEQMEYNEIEGGGVREATAVISGAQAFGSLKFESGVHRVQRVPATEGAGRVHTSTVSVVLLAEVEDVDFDVSESDLKIETMRASGAGGQSVNKTESAVRMTHIPTGVTVHCADERSQHMNRAKAFKYLQARLYDMHKQEQSQAASAARKGQIGSGDRSERIRTYNFAQDRVTDHRVQKSVFGVEQMLATGGPQLEELMEALRRKDAADRITLLD